MAETLKASVIICTRNHASLLPGIIGDLCAQNFPRGDFEIIVVDNGSTDDTREVVESNIVGNSVNIRYVFENRPGITFARNRGAKEARYPYLVYIDDDCRVGSDWLPQFMQGFELDENVMLVAGRVVMDFDDQKIPPWLGPKSYRWLSAYDYPCSRPCLMADRDYIVEGNMAVKAQALELLGGFLGMDQFGNPHVSANESMYLLQQVKKAGGKIAFVPGALEYHHKTIPGQKEIILRAFWNGVSAGILEFLCFPAKWYRNLFNISGNFAAAFVFLVFSFLSILILNRAGAMYHLLRAVRRFGLALCEMRLVGDWHRIRSWTASNMDSKVIKTEKNIG